MLTVQAKAKINLTLEVLGKRPDDYHEIATVMQTLVMNDSIELEEADELSLTLTTKLPEIQIADNLVIRAARLLQQRMGVEYGASIKLTKRIPIAAGLGGGSSDAAAALLGLNELWGHWLPFTELTEIAVHLGSDVPFFLYNGTALARGRGEIIEVLPPFPPHWVVLLVPDLALEDKTRQLYGLISPEQYSQGEATRAVAETLRQGGVPDSGLFVNAFQTIVLDRFPQARLWYGRMLQRGAHRVWLSGSGPSLYALFTDEEEARIVGGRLRAEGANVYVTCTS